MTIGEQIKLEYLSDNLPNLKDSERREFIRLCEQEDREAEDHRAGVDWYEVA